MLSAEFETAIPANDQSPTYALGGAANGIGFKLLTPEFDI
jgi:hypothetical protein